MNLSGVMDEVGQALESIPGLRVFPFDVDRVTPPAAIVGYPLEISYDMTAGRALDGMAVPVFVLVSRTDQRSARDSIAAYLDGDGPRSIKKAIDGYTFTACNTVRVTKATPEYMTIGGTEYLGAVLELMISGKGAARNG